MSWPMRSRKSSSTSGAHGGESSCAATRVVAPTFRRLLLHSAPEVGTDPRPLVGERHFALDAIDTLQALLQEHEPS